MQISDRLRQFLEAELKKLPRHERKEADLRKQKERDRKRLERSEPYRRLKALELLKKTGDITAPEFESKVGSLKKQVAQMKNDLKKLHKSKIMPEGKSQYHRKNFISMCWYHIKKETKAEANEQEQIKIYRWIEDFLNKNNFKKQNGKHYNTNDIKRIIYDHCYGRECEISKDPLESYFDFMYSTFK